MADSGLCGCAGREELQTSEDVGLNEACGVFGCVATGTWPTQLDVPHIISLGLVGLQHRGQESAGIVTSHGGTSPFRKHKAMGLVGQIFTEDVLAKLHGNLGIGHTRYSTAGTSDLTNCQPFNVETLHGWIGVAHNGELVNALRLRENILRHGVGLSTTSDSEVITQILARPPPGSESDGADWLGRIKQLMNETMLSYSLLIMHGESVYAVRDPYGNRPCVLAN